MIPVDSEACDMRTVQTQIRRSFKTFGSIRGLRTSVLFSLLLTLSVSVASGQDDPSRQFNTFVKRQAAELRSGDVAPATADEWSKTRTKLRAELLRAWGGFPEVSCPLEPQVLGQLDRDGYRVERIVFQTMPDVWMTANAYVPDAAKDEKVPAVLCVHGHWPGAKQDPVVQSRCIGLAKLGFFVLCVDAFGAGERGVEKKLGEYHGEMTGAMLFLTGRPLSGIQVYENMRAVDYLQSRPEVDGEHIGITGASGGGNQTMYAGAFDERFRCVVPTCSVGNYQAYLSAACCMCEVVPGILKHTEEGNVLGLAAGRGLMVTSATLDAFQFSVDQAKISVMRARQIAALDAGLTAQSVAHTIIESPHHYNQPMREAMYGWMTKHLKGQGDGGPITEPEIVTEDPEALRCFPGETRPDEYITLPRFVAAESKRLLQIRRDGSDRQFLNATSEAKSDDERAHVRKPLVAALESVLGGMPVNSPLNVRSKEIPDQKTIELTFESEPGLEIYALCDATSTVPGATVPKLAVIVDVENGALQAFSGKRAQELRAEGWTIVAPELRATGRFAVAPDKIGNAPDHNSAEWSLWLGRPLLGQWAWDLHRTLDAYVEKNGAIPSETAIMGEGPSGIIALTAAALDTRLTHVMTVDSLASYVTDKPFRGQRLGVLVPGLLRDVGDVAHIAALIAPRKLTVTGGVTGDGRTLTVEELRSTFSLTTDVFARFGVADRLELGLNSSEQN